MQSAGINMHVGPLYYAAQREVILPGCSAMLRLLSECYLSLNKHILYFLSLLSTCLIINHIHMGQFEKETEIQMISYITDEKKS